MKGVFRRLAGVLGLFAAAILSMGASQCSQSQTIELSIFHTNDIHSHMRPPKADEFKLGGMARMSTLLQQLRPSRAVSITLDAGDYSEGSWPYSVDTGANMLRILDAMSFDAAVVGNHDYLAGPDRMIQTRNEAGVHFPVLASNLDFSEYAHGAEFRNAYPSTYIIQRGGLKIGVIGLTTIDYPFASYLKPVIATDPVRDAQAQAKILRPQVDVLLIVSHNLFETNMQLAQSVLGVDAVISGHSHTKKSRAVMVENAGRQVPVAETGQWGTFLGDLRLTIDQKNKVVKYLSYELHPVEPTLAEDANVKAIIDGEYDKIAKSYGSDIFKVVADTDADMDISDSHRPTVGHVAVKGYRDATGADLALEMLKLAGVRVLPGQLTIEDLHDFMPHILNWASGKEWTVKIWHATGKDLSFVMNVFYSVGNVLPLGNTGFLAVDGMEIVWQPKDADHAVPAIVSTTIGGAPLDTSRMYRVALTDGMTLALTIANEKFHLGMDLSNIEDTGIEAWRTVIAYATKMQHLTSEGIQAGGRSYTLGPDLGVFRHTITYDGTALRVQVANDGKGPAVGGKLTCSSGLPNDSVAYDTELEKYAKIGSVDLPQINGGERLTVSLPWTPSTSGFWPILCGTDLANDGYGGNNASDRVFNLARANSRWSVAK
ncbi:MAG: bifunctional metallophosphatase/5'-nucleotidase [Deltaproteobacteria bacterium]|nr:bifunctional metallophosphatase/5'-nucleotidase [Deltaproteobacteria bacterium]